MEKETREEMMEELQWLEDKEYYDEESQKELAEVLQRIIQTKKNIDEVTKSFNLKYHLDVDAPNFGDNFSPDEFKQIISEMLGIILEYDRQLEDYEYYVECLDAAVIVPQQTMLEDINRWHELMNALLKDQ